MSVIIASIWESQVSRRFAGWRSAFRSIDEPL
jgi:hypothetical protein